MIGEDERSSNLGNPIRDVILIRFVWAVDELTNLGI